MTRTITIDPVTRIEGHAKITLMLTTAVRPRTRASTSPSSAASRNFAAATSGRCLGHHRICGICPVSHLLASAKTGDAILGVRIPPTAAKLRRMLNWAQIVQSHALSFFHLSSPDLLLGMDSDPALRNVVGLIQKHPDIARKGIRLRKFGQDTIRILGGRSVHPAWTVPGGVREPLSAENRDLIKEMLPEAFDTIDLALTLLKDASAGYEDEAAHYGNFPSLYMGLVTPEGGLEHYDGLLRVVDSGGKILEPGLEPALPRDHRRGGRAVDLSQFPYYKPYAYSGPSYYKMGMYRVGLLARLNVCEFAGTPKADEELRASSANCAARSSGQHGLPLSLMPALIEILFALEKIAETVEDPHILDERVRSAPMSTASSA